eukprot:TRINITY_DN6700_c2_g1_i1.p1 TRINITY_DN6700_c2_g1~~TRINITY_DN6700_c2_g1_i1.p1  ORF type:complete len:1040 (+),score=307.95 TRINITY_DN6700_c2_g1_i1:87-3206(+)
MGGAQSAEAGAGDGAAAPRKAGGAPPQEKYRQLVEAGGGASSSSPPPGGARDRLRRKVDDARDAGGAPEGARQNASAASSTRSGNSRGGNKSRKGTPNGESASVVRQNSGLGLSTSCDSRRHWTPPENTPISPPRRGPSGGSSGVPPTHSNGRGTPQQRQTSPDSGPVSPPPRCTSAPGSRENSAGGDKKRTSPYLRHRQAIHETHDPVAQGGSSKARPGSASLSNSAHGYEPLDMSQPKNSPVPATPPTSALFGPPDESGDQAPPGTAMSTSTEAVRKKVRKLKQKHGNLGEPAPARREDVVNDAVSAFQKAGLVATGGVLPVNYMTFTLEEDDDELGYTDDDYRYAQWIGMDLETHPHLLHIARKGLRAGVPEPWVSTKKNGEVVYENVETGDVSENHPLDDFFRNWYAAAVNGEEYMCVEEYVMTVLRPSAMAQIQISTSIVQFVDVTSGAIIKMKSCDRGLRYLVNNQPRPLVRKVVYDPKTKIIRFPEIHKGATLPSSHSEELATAIRRLCHLGKVEHNIPAPPPGVAGAGGIVPAHLQNSKPTARPTFDRPGGASPANNSIIPPSAHGGSSHASPLLQSQGSVVASVTSSPTVLSPTQVQNMHNMLSFGGVSPTSAPAGLKKKKRKKGEAPSAADFSSKPMGITSPELPPSSLPPSTDSGSPPPDAPSPPPVPAGDGGERVWTDDGGFAAVDAPDDDEKEPMFPTNFPEDALPAPPPQEERKEEVEAPNEEARAELDRTAEEVLYQRFIADVEKNGISENEVLQHGNFSDQDVDEMTRDLGFNVMERYKIKGRIDLKRMELVADKKNAEIEASMLAPPTPLQEADEAPPQREEDAEYERQADENADILMEIGPENVPDDYVCTITGEIMIDPVSTSDGHVYEKGAIQAWLVSHDTSPNTNKALESKALVPNLPLKRVIRNWREALLKGMRMQAQGDPRRKSTSSCGVRPTSSSSAARPGPVPIGTGEALPPSSLDCQQSEDMPPLLPAADDATPPTSPPQDALIPEPSGTTVDLDNLPDDDDVFDVAGPGRIR